MNKENKKKIRKQRRKDINCAHKSSYINCSKWRSCMFTSPMNEASNCPTLHKGILVVQTQVPESYKESIKSGWQTANRPYYAGQSAVNTLKHDSYNENADATYAITYLKEQ